MAISNLDKICKAIQLINSTAQITISGTDENTISSIIDTIQWHNTDAISKAEIEAMIPTAEAALEQDAQDAINKKASAKEKLLALGLTEEEIKLTFGL